MSDSIGTASIWSARNNRTNPSNQKRKFKRTF